MRSHEPIVQQKRQMQLPRITRCSVVAALDDAKEGSGSDGRSREGATRNGSNKSPAPVNHVGVKCAKVPSELRRYRRKLGLPSAIETLRAKDEEEIQCHEKRSLRRVLHG